MTIRLEHEGKMIPLQEKIEIELSFQFSNRKERDRLKGRNGRYYELSRLIKESSDNVKRWHCMSDGSPVETRKPNTKAA